MVDVTEHTLLLSGLNECNFSFLGIGLYLDLENQILFYGTVSQMDVCVQLDMYVYSSPKT